MSWDPYLDLDTGVLRNRLNLTTPDQLAQAEADITAMRIAQLWDDPVPGDYDLDHLCAVHARIFGDIYDWAGQLRTVRVGKGGALFCLPDHLVETAERIFERLAADQYLRDLTRPAFVDELTTLFDRINKLHPFRDGNGRSQRAFLAQLARDGGYQLDWSGMDPASNLVASQRARVDGDYGPLRAMLDRLVEPGASPQPPTPPPRDP